MKLKNQSEIVVTRRNADHWITYIAERLSRRVLLARILEAEPPQPSVVCSAFLRIMGKKGHLLFDVQLLGTDWYSREVGTTKLYGSFTALTKTPRLEYERLNDNELRKFANQMQSRVEVEVVASGERVVGYTLVRPPLDKVNYFALVREVDGNLCVFNCEHNLRRSSPANRVLVIGPKPFKRLKML